MNKEMINYNEIVNFSHENGESELRREALECHYRIIADIELAGNAIADFYENLKVMCDKKLFAQLGYSTFGEYTEKEHNIKERQAYNYINSYKTFGKDFLQLNAKSYGITKLQLLASANWEDREKIIATTDIENTSVSELKEKIAEIESLKTQISFLENMPKTVIQEPLEKVKAEIEKEVRLKFEKELEIELEKGQEKIDELERKIIEKTANTRTNDEFKKYQEEIKAEIKAQADVEVKKLKQEISEKDKASAKLVLELREQKIQVEKTKNNAMTESAEQQAFKEKYLAELERVEKLEKQIKLSENPGLTKFKFKFEQLQIVAAEIAELITGLDEQSQNKCKKAMTMFVENINL